MIYYQGKRTNWHCRLLKKRNHFFHFHFFAAEPTESVAPRLMEALELEPGDFEVVDSDPLMLLPVDVLAAAFWEGFELGLFLIMSSETTTNSGFKRP